MASTAPGDTPSTAAQDAQANGAGKDPDAPPALGPLASPILPHILNLYNIVSQPADYDVYSPTAVFEDPLMRAQNVKEIKSAFYAIPKLFREARMTEYTVEENMTSPGNGEIRVDNRQHYSFMGRMFDVESLITLQVEDGKVVKHVDMWNKQPHGRYGILRRGNMLLTHMVMGFGKDPKA